MTIAEGSLESPRSDRGIGTALRVVTRSPRFWVYAVSSVIALVTSCLLGKDVMWDTLSYHLYAGFSALHNRFGQDYFAAGTQSYFNPYIYVPYYLLARSGLSALSVSVVIGLMQSGILWLTYELAISVSPVEGRSTRTLFAVCAVSLAFANPILINQIGTSYVDILTGEMVIAAWLLLIRAVHSPGMPGIVCAGLLLGMVSALKMTNGMHAVAACAILFFLPLSHGARARHAIVFGAAIAISFLIVMIPWSIHLERQFGSPLFPLFNSLFRSPQFPAVSLQDHRFIPDSLANALWRPVAIAAPITLIDDEFAAPDLRYVVLLVLAVSAAAGWVWRRYRRREDSAAAPVVRSPSRRAFVALGCGFLLDWILWIFTSGNGRYFIPMACIAGVLGIGLVFRLFATRPRLGAYLLVVVLGGQVFELYAGATYRAYVPWDDGAPYELVIPKQLTTQRNLYLMLSVESLSFMAPFLAHGSGLVNLEGDYVLPPTGPNGSHVRSLIARYAPNVRVLVLDSSLQARSDVGLPDAAHVNDVLAHYGLRAVADDCLALAVKNVRRPFIDVPVNRLPISLPQGKIAKVRVPVSPDRYLAACRVVRDDDPHAILFAGDRKADVVFNRLEDACPPLFQPRRPVTQDYGDERTGYRWMRAYSTTGLAVMITAGEVRFFDPVRGGRYTYLGTETDWERELPQLACGRRGERYYVKVVHPQTRPISP